MECNDLLLVGKKTLNINILVGYGDVDAKARVWIEYEDDECWKGYVIGEDKTDRSCWINDQPTDRSHPTNKSSSPSLNRFHPV